MIYKGDMYVLVTVARMLYRAEFRVLLMKLCPGAGIPAECPFNNIFKPACLYTVKIAEGLAVKMPGFGSPVSRCFDDEIHNVGCEYKQQYSCKKRN